MCSLFAVCCLFVACCCVWRVVGCCRFAVVKVCLFCVVVLVMMVVDWLCCGVACCWCLSAFDVVWWWLFGVYCL